MSFRTAHGLHRSHQTPSTPQGNQHESHDLIGTPHPLRYLFPCNVGVPVAPPPHPLSWSAAMKTEMWEVTRPKPYGKNPRKMTQKAVDKVAASIQKFGFRQPIVVDKKGVVIVGHKRLIAAQQLGWPRVPVTVATDLTPAQVKAYRIADNRVGEGMWDRGLLAEELEDLRVEDFNLEMTGFDESQIQEIMGDVEFAEENREEESQDQPTTITCPKCKHQFTIE